MPSKLEEHVETLRRFADQVEYWQRCAEALRAIVELGEDVTRDRVLEECARQRIEVIE